MDRRSFVGTFALGCLAARGVFAQPARKVARVGYLIPTQRETSTTVLAMFAEGMRRRGYVLGETLAIDARAESDIRRMPALAAELVAAKVDVIVAASPVAILAASRATKEIPIVMAFWGGEGLLESGMVANLARPGGNVTGLHMLSDELDGKRLELLSHALPKAHRIGVIGVRKLDDLGHEVAEAARAAGIELVIDPAPPRTGYGDMLAGLGRRRVDAVLVPSSPRFALEYEQIIAAAATRRVPAIYEWGYMARAGGLMAYGPDLGELYERVADYVSRVLKGAKPADLPVEQPTKFELVINTKTARALGLTIPQSLLLRADELIQ